MVFVQFSSVWFGSFLICVRHNRNRFNLTHTLILLANNNSKFRLISTSIKAIYFDAERIFVIEIHHFNNIFAIWFDALCVVLCMCVFFSFFWFVDCIWLKCMRFDPNCIYNRNQLKLRMNYQYFNECQDFRWIVHSFWLLSVDIKDDENGMIQKNARVTNIWNTRMQICIRNKYEEKKWHTNEPNDVKQWKEEKIAAKQTYEI